MRLFTILLVGLFAITTSAQQVDWLTATSVDYTLNPGLPRHTLASAPGRLVAMRMVEVDFVYGTAPYGKVALDALDPVTGGPLLSCLLLDTVSVGATVVDPAGIAYFTGRFMGDVLEFCDGSQLPGIGGTPFTENHFLLAWDLAGGSVLWMRNLSASHPQSEDVPSVALDPDGRLWYVMQDFLDGRVVRVDAAGNDVEVRVISGIRRFGTLSFDPWGGLYVSGSCENGVLTFGGQGFPVESDEGYNMFVLRYQPDGMPGFAQFGDDVTFTHPTVAATSDGHAYLSGSLHLSGEVWEGLQFEGTNWGADIFVVKLDSTGQFLWGREGHPADFGISGDIMQASGPGIAVDALNNVYLIGANRGVVDWGNGVQSTGTIPERSLSVVAFDPDGTAQWAVSSSPSTWYVEAQAITTMAGPGTVHFICHVADPFTMGGITVGAQGEQIAVVGLISELTTGVGVLEPQKGPQVWPSPASEVLFMEWPGAGTVVGELVNGAGQRVRSLALVPGRNAVDIGALAPGLYLLRVEGGEAVRVVVE